MLNVCIPRPKKDGSTYWHKIGTAFDGEKGITIYLDSLPIADKEGRCVMKLFEPLNKEQRREPGSTEPNDEIPW